MNAWRTTGIWLAAASLAVAVTFITRPAHTGAGASSDALEADQGRPIAPLLTDPTQVKSLEVIRWDELAARPRGFKVEFKDGRWVVPSAFNYPVDATEPVVKAASSFVNVLSQRAVTDRAQEHGRLGVIDPSDEKLADLTGRGTRVTLRDQGGKVLADLIIGNAVADPGAQGSPPSGAPTSSYVREVGKARVYAAPLRLELSTRLVDWITTDLIEAAPASVRELRIDRYTISEQSGTLSDIRALTVSRVGNDPAVQGWQMTGQLDGKPEPGAGEQTIADSTKVERVLGALRDVRVIAVQPKPANLAKLLGGGGNEGRITLSDQANLQRHGFFLTPKGQLLANEGQVSLTTADGLLYTLWLGELALDEQTKLQSEGAKDEGAAGEAPPAAGAPKPDPSLAIGRYVMVTVTPEPGAFGPAPSKPADLLALEAKEQQATAEAPLTEADRSLLESARAAFKTQTDAFDAKVKGAQERAAALSKRFGDWYYVASARDLDKLRPARADLLPATAPAPGSVPNPAPAPAAP
jgi:hypothetical protein